MAGVSSEMICLLRQFLIGKSFSDSVADDVSQSLHSRVVDVAFVHSKDELIDIAVGVFGAPVMVGTFVATLQNCPDAFDAVS